MYRIDTSTQFQVSVLTDLTQSGTFSQVEALPWSDSPMTLLVALIDSDGGVVIAADGQESTNDGETWGSEPTEKIYPVPGQRLMWGWSGTSDVGPFFGDWLCAEAPMGDWQRLAAEAGPKFRDICLRSSPQYPGGDSAIAAGWFGTDPGILWVDFTGHANIRTTRVFEGMAKWAALWGWEYAAALQGNTPETLSRWLDHLVAHGRAQGVGPPVGIWRSGSPDEEFQKLTF